MNRSILIVICDFLLVSLLAFSTVDINKVAEEGTAGNLKLDLATNRVDSGKDLAAAMRLALEDERKGRDQLLGELTKTRETAGEQQALLAQREKQVQTYQQELRTREQESLRLQQQQASLQQEFATAQTNLLSLSQQLEASSTEAGLSKEKLAAMEAELKKRAAEAAAMQQQLAQIAQSNQVVLTEKQQLAGQLQVAQTEKRLAGEQVARMTEEVKVEREEKAKLAESVKTLASHSSELAQEIKENRALAPNTIFSEFLSNRVQASFYAVRPGLFGTSKRKETETVLVTSGTNTFALCHVQETPLALASPGTDWDGLTGTLSRQATRFNITSLWFSLRDPRVVLIPVTAAEARQLGCQVYRTSSDPFKFQDAVLVGAREGYYGECKFQIDLATPDYVKLDRSFLRGLFGQFNPSRGDLVFSKNGELLGVMANSTYCLMLRNFDAAASFQLGQDVRGQHTGEILSELYAAVAGLPGQLQ